MYMIQFMGDNAVWQDPDGEVRKWQRDTGTGAWGDPEKQSSKKTLAALAQIALFK